MKRYCNLLIIIPVVLVLFVILLAFFTYSKIEFTLNTPPNYISVEERFLKCYSDIDIVIGFMIDSGFNNIYIHDKSGTAWADFRSVPLDAVTHKAVERLMNGNYISISKNGDTIWFLQWRGLQDVGCGIAYTIKGESVPRIPYQTEIIAMDKKGWFYYVSKGT